MSMTWSAARIASRSCSTTMTVFPRSRRRAWASMRRALSRACRATLRSSRPEGAPTRAAPIRAASRMRAPLPGRERLRAAIERQVVETDVDEKAQARRDRFEQRLGDGLLARAEGLGHRFVARGGRGLGGFRRRHPELFYELAHMPQRHGTDLRDVLAAELDGERLRAKALALAGVARARDEKPPELVV